MGMSVYDQVDKRKYFSVSTIDKKRMEEYNINMTLKSFRQLVKKVAPYAEIMTGDPEIKTKRTKIYRYEDFRNAK